MSRGSIARSAGTASRASAALLLLVSLSTGATSKTFAQEEPAAKPRSPDRTAGQASLGAAIPSDGALDGGFAMQTRVGVQLRPRLQAGGLLDWHRMAEHDLVVRPSGFVLDNPHFDLFPLLGYVQYGGTGPGMTLPYVGVAVGYQLAFLEANNVDTEIFDGPGWQGWVGVSRRLTYHGVPSKALIGIEAAYNRARVSGHMWDPLQGSRHDTFDLSGWVVRLGFSFEGM